MNVASASFDHLYKRLFSNITNFALCRIRAYSVQKVSGLSRGKPRTVSDARNVN